MKVLIDKSFEKDVSVISDKKILHNIAKHIELIKSAGKLSEIPKCKKLKGHTICYRIKIGDYRLGFVFENQTIEVVRFLHRSKIYKIFP